MKIINLIDQVKLKSSEGKRYEGGLRSINYYFKKQFHNLSHMTEMPALQVHVT